MESKRKSNTIVSHEINGLIVRFFSPVDASMTFDCDGAKVAGSPEAIAALTENGRRALFHGIVQKISDRAAIGRDPETGLSASPEEKFEAMKQTADRLMSGGPWNVVSAGGTGNAGGVLYRAMRAVYPNTWDNREAFAEWLKGQAVKESERLKKAVSVTDVQKAFLGIKKIAKEIERMRQEEGKATGINAGDMLQELEKGPTA